MNSIERRRLQSRAGIVILALTDICSLVLVFLLAVAFRKYLMPVFVHKLPTFRLSLGLYYWIFPVWIFIMAYEGGYTKRFTLWDEVKFIWKSAFFASLAIFTVLFIGKQGSLYSRGLLISTGVLALFLMPVMRMLTKKALYSVSLLKRNVLVIGAGDTALLALSALHREPNLGYEILAFVDDDGPDVPDNIEGIKVHRRLQNLERYIRMRDIHDIVIAKPEMDSRSLSKIINRIQHKVDNTLYFPDLTGISVLSAGLRHFFHEQAIAIEIGNNLARPANYLAKRILDYSVAVMLFLILALPILVIAAMIRLTSKGPAIYTHIRMGKNCEPFKCYKFRTMYKDAAARLEKILAENPDAMEEWTAQRKLRNDPRITPLGRFLRETSLDELPQIMNVLRGEMSLVGPRPVTKDEIDNFYKDTAELCFSVPPGITGLWQVSGRSGTTYDQRISLDSWYVRNWNPWLDMIILIKTAYVVITREGAH